MVQQTLYQIEVQKNLKDKPELNKGGAGRVNSLVDENFTEEEIIAQAQKILEQEEQEMLRVQREEEERTAQMQKVVQQKYMDKISAMMQEKLNKEMKKDKKKDGDDKSSSSGDEKEATDLKGSKERSKTPPVKLKKTLNIKIFKKNKKEEDSVVASIKKEIQDEVNGIKDQKVPALQTFIKQLPTKLQRSFELKFVEEAMFVDHFSGTFYSMINKYKKKHNLLVEDQAEYYFEAIFLLTIQATFCIAILQNMNWSKVTEYERDFLLNLVLFFTSLMLHFASIYTIRNGIQMCRFTVFHSDQLSHPLAAFMLGIFVILVNILCEVTNTLYSLSKSTVSDVIAKFVAFKILIQVQDYYTRQRANFSIKKEVGASPLVIIEDMSKVFGKKKSKKQNANKDVGDDKKEKLIEDENEEVETKGAGRDRKSVV